MLPEGGQVGVVMQEARDASCAGQDCVERHVAETGQVGGTDDDAGRRVHRPGQADAQGPHATRRRAILFQRFRDGIHDPIDDVLTAAGGLGRVPHHRFQAAAIIRHRDAELRSTKVDADEGHGYRGSDYRRYCQRGRTSGRNVRAASAAPAKSAMAVARKMRWY